MKKGFENMFRNFQKFEEEIWDLGDHSLSNQGAGLAQGFLM